MKTVKKILVTTDFSGYSLSGLEYAMSQEEFSGAQIFLLHVVHDAVLVAPYPNIDLHSETIMKDSEDQAKRFLADIMSEKFSGRNDIRQTIRRGEPSQEIIRFAKEKHIDLIIMATHGRTGLAHVLLGSVAERVVRYSPIPVLTIKPDKVRMSLSSQNEIEHLVEEH